MANVYRIETDDGVTICNYFTNANDHKSALLKLQLNSSDWKNIVKSDRDLIIKITKIN